MIPTYIHLALLLPGLKMPEEAPKEEACKRDYASFPGEIADGFEWIENEAKVIYAVDRKKVVKLEEIAIKDHRLAERLLCFRGIDELQDRFHIDESAWLAEWLANGDHESLDDDNMAALWAVASRLVDPPPGEGVAAAGGALILNERTPPAILPEDFIVEIGFVGLWQTHVSGGGLEEGPELDHVEFVGLGKIVLAPELPERAKSKSLWCDRCDPSFPCWLLDTEKCRHPESFPSSNESSS